MNPLPEFNPLKQRGKSKAGFPRYRCGSSNRETGNKDVGKIPDGYPGTYL